MKIKIITIHAMHNPGSVLQAYALQEFLLEQGNDVEIIDYRPSYFYSEGSGIKLFLKKILFRKQYESRKNKFERFILDNLILTSRFQTYGELVSAQLCSDVFIVGSDQLWNDDFPCGNDEAFFLSFTSIGLKASYGTSLGKGLLSEERISFLKKKLNSFSYLSVREKKSSLILSERFKREVKWVLDPVFLLEKERYVRFIGEKPIINSKYAVLYLTQKSAKLDSIVRKLKKNGYLIVLVGGFTRRCKCDIHFIDAGPNEFLNLIYYSDIVVSSSFHATAFSHIFHKNFAVILPDRNQERLLSLIHLSNLDDRVIDESNPEINFKPINWENVDFRLMELVDISKNYLNFITSEDGK